MGRTSRLIASLTLVVSTIFSLPASNALAASEFNNVAALGAATYLGGNEVPSNGAAMETSRGGNGYYILGTDGGVFTYGDAEFYGSAAGLSPHTFLDMAVSPAGGYWLVASDGGVFSFGTNFYGSLGGQRLNKPVVAMASTSTGNGYWLVAADGGVFTFGDANFFGGTVALSTSSPVDIIPTADNGGYWIVTSDGAVFSFGNAPYLGGANGIASATIVDAAPNNSGGYWILASDGAIFSFGANYYGNSPANAMGATTLASRGSGDGYWILRSANSARVPANSGSGRRIVYSNSQQRVWLIESNESVYRTYLVSGRIGVPNPGHYRVYSKTVSSTAHAGTLRLPYMTRFAFGKKLSIGFHGIPLRRNGTPIQSDAELGQYRSAGCVRQNQNDARLLYEWTPVGTVVVVLR